MRVLLRLSSGGVVICSTAKCQLLLFLDDSFADLGQLGFESPHGLNVGFDLGVGGGRSERIANCFSCSGSERDVGAEHGRTGRCAADQRGTRQAQRRLVNLQNYKIPVLIMR